MQAESWSLWPSFTLYMKSAWLCLYICSQERGSCQDCVRGQRGEKVKPGRREPLFPLSLRPSSHRTFQFFPCSSHSLAVTRSSSAGL
jgi:hypothetical protein